MASANETVQLIIRTANNKYADFNLELSSLLSVYDLKQKIMLNHPTKPVPKDQRLIFSGKLLDDNSLLHQIFLKSTLGTPIMIHLVLDSDKNASTPRTPQSPTTTIRSSSPSPIDVDSQPPPPAENSTTINPSRSNTYEQYVEELNKYQQQLQQFLINPAGVTPTTDYQTQAYLQYCYTHYQMYQNLVTYQRTVAAPFTILQQPIPGGSSNTAAASPSPPPPPPAAAAAAAGAGAGNNNNNNNNEFEQENDLLGILNMLVELFVLCSIIYFYSTFSRFLVVFLIFALLYLHCRGYLSLQRRRRVQVQQPPPVVPEQAAGNDAEDEVENEQVGNEAQNQNDIQRPNPTPPPPSGPIGDNQISTTRVLLTAVSTFFSSLIPERPQRA